MIKISPSLLACDFSNIGEEIKKVESAGADMLHLDVMDGRFVPNITFGAPVIKSIRKCSTLPFDVHLMISEPLKYISDFANAGADIITFHAESDSDIMATISKIKKFGKKVGISIKPKTDTKILFPYLKYIDVVLVMTVEPGFGGQTFMEEQLQKTLILKNEAQKNNLSFEIELDGGINTETIEKIKDYPVDICVSGTCIFSSKDMKSTINKLKLR
ncbi:MAG: ribulose-phosphate 3-epimerase [Clostridia bacterium]|nr:ribulose-phosphate 3-epimerase [Clostridia bacterium]MBR2734887.1 ribulose-phosphate 3-epimerase [Clostridia bacterium]